MFVSKGKYEGAIDSIRRHKEEIKLLNGKLNVATAELFRVKEELRKLKPAKKVAKKTTVKKKESK